jgi:hypothetical protein
MLAMGAKGGCDCAEPRNESTEAHGNPAPGKPL